MTETPKTVTQPQKPQAVSHMLWFFVFPSLIFMGWASYRFVNGVLKPKPQDAFSKLAEVRSSHNSGDRWQAAYGLAQALQKMSQDGTFATLEPAKKDELYDSLGKVLKDNASDARLKKYLILTLGQLGDLRALPALESGTLETDPETRFYSAWSLVDLLIKHPEAWTEKHSQLALAWIKDKDVSLKKIGTTFLVQDKKTDHKKEIRELLKDGDVQVRWNAAVALVSSDDMSGLAILKEPLTLESLRAADIQSSEDLTRVVRAAWEAAKKSGSPELLATAQKLRQEANDKTPEGRAILRALAQ